MSKTTNKNKTTAPSQTTPTVVTPSSDELEKIRDLISRFEQGMLVTRSPEGALRSRPMRIIAQQNGGKVVMVSAEDAAKVDEIRSDSRVNVTLQRGKVFVSITGTATVDQERQRIGHYFEPSWRLWFPEGPSDPQIALIDVEPEVIEYWDGGGLNQLKFVAAAARALLNDEKIDGQAVDHNAIRVDGR